jgi:haloacetate dehalogenase
MFTSFEARRFTLDDAVIHARVGGAGPALLLLHGHPQSHVMWHRVANDLAMQFTVVALDLRG